MIEASVDALPAGDFSAEREIHRSRRTLIEVGVWGGQEVVAKRSADRASLAAQSRAAREFQLLALARSECVVRALALDERAGLLLLERLEGGSLLELPAPVSMALFLAIARDACRALAAVHEAQLIHKDVNPANFVRTRDGRTKLVDFDIATRAAWEAQEFRAPS
ncbi:MAG TPA: protein kinase, partial [Polyangiaceae bacterium]|nr:protein kinase [Polyangiaceae bacterium]